MQWSTKCLWASGCTGGSSTKQMLWEQQSAWRQDAAWTASFPICSEPICQRHSIGSDMSNLQMLLSRSRWKPGQPAFGSWCQRVTCQRGVLSICRSFRLGSAFPDWLDRIAYLQRLLKPVQPVQKKQSSQMDTLQTSLTSLQASEHWPQVVKCMGVKDLDAKAKYDHRLGIRKDSDVHLTGDINEFEMLFAKHGWISRKQACMTKFCSLTEKS